MRLEARVTEPVADLKSEFFSARPEVVARVPLGDRKSEFLTKRLDARVMDPEKDWKREDFSAKDEAGFRAAARLLPIPFSMELESVTVPLADRNSETCRGELEVMLMSAVLLVEQDRGIVLQVIFPELTFMAMLPMVNVSAPVIVLKIVFFSARLDA